jgi:hexosaminidase
MKTKMIRTALLLTMLMTQAGSSMAQQEPARPATGATFDQLFTKETPVVAKRGVHMHLTGLPPTGDRFVQLLRIFAAARYNVVVIEWEDSFPWTVEKRFRSRTAYTPDEIRRICKTADELGLELIPLVQCLGHMETPLSTPGYEHLREVPNNSSGINPLDPRSRELIQKMVDDVLALMPGVKQFHLGGDEARTLGQNPDTKAYMEQHGKGALYLQHVEPILDNLNKRGIRPILWHDMMIDWDGKALKSLAGKCDLMIWGYGGNPDTTEHHYNTKYIRRFQEHGVVQWGATAYKGAEGETPERHTADRPVLGARVENATAWVDVAQRFELTGVVATGWSRWSVDTLQCVPIDAALDSLVAVGVILHDGELPTGGVPACVDALEELGEKERFEACRKAMERMTNVRRNGWKLVQQVREQQALCRLDPRRTSARNKLQGNKRLGYLQGTVRHAERIADEVRRSFDGLVDPVWIEEYVSTRLSPLKDELDALTAQDEALK